MLIMQDPVLTANPMLPFWVQWLFAAGGITLIVAVFLALWTKLVKIEKRIVRLEGAVRSPASPAATQTDNPTKPD